MRLGDSVPWCQGVFAVLGVVLLLVQSVGVTAGAAALGGGSDAAVQTALELSAVSDRTKDTNTTVNSTDRIRNESANESTPSLVGQETRNGAARSDPGLLVPVEREIEVGETLVLGYRYTGCGKLVGNCSGFNYDWDLFASEGDPDDAELLHDITDTMPDDIAHGGRANTFRATEPGEYVVTAYRTEGQGDPVRDSVTIEVTEEEYVNGKSKHELLSEYAPIINFHPDEQFYPTRYEAYVENSKLMENDVAVEDTVVPGTSLFDLYYEEGSDPVGDPEPYLSPETEGTSDHSVYQGDVVEETYPNTTYGSVTRNVDYNGREYTALGYWMVYLHDPKPEDERGTLVEVASHTGDQEGFVVLVNESGPQYVAAQQHFGGELQKWEHVESVDNRPEVYVGEGSHPTFFGPRNPAIQQREGDGWAGGEIDYVYQQQYLCSGSGGPGYYIRELNLQTFGCSVDNAGEPDRPFEAKDYVDPVEVGETWHPSDYDVTLLTGEEAWSEYAGNVYRYPGPPTSKTLKGSFINQGSFNEGDLEDFVDIDRNARQQREAFPTEQQIDGYLISNPSDSDLDVEYSLSGEPTAVEVEVNNNGYQPHDFVVGQQNKPATRQKVFVESEDVYARNHGRDIEATYPGETTATIPVDVDGQGPWDVDLEMTAFGDDYVLGTTTVQLTRASQVDAEIISNEGTAGSIDDPQPVRTTVQLERDGSAYQGPFPDFTVSVGNESVNTTTEYNSGVGEYRLTYTPPTQDQSGAYDLTIDIEDGPTLINESDAITYSNTTGTQVAANLQIDRSSSMDEVIDEAKEGGATFVEQSDDDDSVSVVSYADNARTDQSLTELSTGRSDVVDEIEGLSAGGLTNIGASLERGLDSLDSAPDGTTKAAILMTDGIRIKGPSEQEILEDIVPAYNEKGVCLYTIGFGSGADEDLLQDIADASDCGEYRFAGEEGEVDSINQTLQSVYQDLGGEVSDAETIASESGTVTAGNNTTGQFVVDDSVGQTTTNLQIDGLVDPISPAPDSDEPQANIQLAPDTGEQSDEIRLVRPDGAVVNETDANVSKSVVGDTVIYRIDDPQPGEWTYELRNTQSNDAQYSVDVAGEARTELDVYTDAETYSPDSTADFTATLFGSDGPVGNATVEGTVTLPDGNTTELSFDERQAGVYDGTMAPEQAGEYTVEVTATVPNASLERQATKTFTVDATPPLSVSQSDTPEIVSGARETFAVEFDGDSDAKYSLELSEFKAVNGTATISSDDAWLWNDSVSPEAAVNLTAGVERSTPAGTYEATLRAYDIDSDTVVTEAITTEVVDPATFDVELTETNAPVEGGDPLNATAQVTNTGDVSGTQNVSFSLYGAGTNTTELTLASGESTTVEFSVPTTVADNGTRYAVVGSRTDRNATRVDVLGPARVVVGMSEETVIPENESNMTLEAAAINRGDETATQELTLSDENGIIATRIVTLDPDELRRVNFTYSTDATGVSENVTLTSANTSSNTTFITQAMSYADPDGVIDSRGLDIAVLDWKDGKISRDVLDRVTEYWASGEEVY